MDDFIGHPCTRAEFERILAVWEGKECARVYPTEALREPEPPALVDTNKFNELCQLSDEISDPEQERSMIEELFCIYHEQARENIVQLTVYLEQGEYQKLSATAHKFRGLCLNLGLNVLAALARDLEHQSPENPQVLEALLEQIKECLQETNKRLEELFRFED
jgi:HPt (histidine-containing phosphotransfer) domain-containing protein